MHKALITLLFISSVTLAEEYLPRLKARLEAEKLEWVRTRIALTKLVIADSDLVWAAAQKEEKLARG